MKSKTELGAIAAVLSDDVVSIVCTFRDTETQYTYLCTQDLANSLTVGDHVVCTKAVNFVVVEVVHIHEGCELDNLNLDYQWAIQRVDAAEASSLVKWKHQAADRLYRQQRRAAQKALASQFLDGEELDVPRLPRGADDEPTE